MSIDLGTYLYWKDKPISHDQDEWDGKYRTWGEMYLGEGYEIEEPIYYT